MILTGYHSGRDVVKTFSAGRRRRAEYGAGFYFADDIELASRFGPIISEYRLNLKNPLIADQFDVKHVLERESGQSAPTTMREQGEWISKTARRLGHDGIVIRLVTGQRYFVAFRTHQITYMEPGPSPEIPVGTPITARIGPAKWGKAF